jgi:hypothetical protein
MQKLFDEEPIRTMHVVERFDCIMSDKILSFQPLLFRSLDLILDLITPADSRRRRLIDIVKSLLCRSRIHVQKHDSNAEFVEFQGV